MKNSVKHEIRKRTLVFSYSIWDTCLPPKSAYVCMYRAIPDPLLRNKSTEENLPEGINVASQRRERRGGTFRIQERVKPAPLSRGPGRDLLVLCLILPDANDPPDRSNPAGLHVGMVKKEDEQRVEGEKKRGRQERGTVGSYRRSRMTRQANCVISVQRMLPRFPPPPPLPKLSPLYTARVFVSRICRSRRWQLQRARANLSRIAF